MLKRREMLAATGLFLSGIQAAVAQAWPTKPIQIIVPFSAGGGTDLIARTIAEEMRNHLGTLVVENKDGAGSNIGIEYVARAEPSGYTLLLASIGFAINRFLFDNLKYNPDKDFAPVSLLCRVPNLMVVPANSPAKTVEEFIALAKASPGKLTFASSGSGSSLYLAAQLFQREAGIELTHVPYRGSAPALIDLRAGRIDVMFDVISSVSPHVTAGAVRALGVTSGVRAPAFASWPTIAESGLPGFDFSTWFGFFLPAGTRPDIVDRVYRATVQALAEPNTRAKLEQAGAVVVGSTPAELSEHVAREVRRWGPVLSAGRADAAGKK